MKITMHVTNMNTQFFMVCFAIQTNHGKIMTTRNGDKIMKIMVTASFEYCIVVFRHKIFIVILMFFVPFITFPPYFGYVFLIEYDRAIGHNIHKSSPTSRCHQCHYHQKTLPCFATAFKKLRSVTLLSSSCIK